MIKLFCLLSSIVLLHAFLLDTNTTGTSNSLNMDNRYDYLLKLIIEERTARLQLEQNIIKQQQEINAVSGLKTRMDTLEHNQSTIVKDLSSFQYRHNTFVLNINQETKIFQNKYQLMESEIQRTNQRLTTDEEYVGFTAYGRGQGTKSSGTILKFPALGTFIGISRFTTVPLGKLDNGKFTCEKRGFYLVSITVMSSPRVNGEFYIYKRSGNAIWTYLIGKSSTASADYNSATRTIILILAANDTVYVKVTSGDVYVYDYMSSFNVMKVK